MFFFIVKLTCNDIDNLRWKRLVEVFTQTVPKDTLAKYIHFVKGNGCLFGEREPASFDRVKTFHRIFLQ